MNWVDIVIAVLLLISIFMGLRTGIIKMALSLAGVLIGITLAGRYYPTLASHLTFIHQVNVANVVSFIIILVVVMLIAALLAAILTRIVSVLMLGWVNRLVGGVFGLIIGGLFIAALLAIWAKFGHPPAAVGTSALARILLDRFPAGLALLPHEFNSVRQFFQ